MIRRPKYLNQPLIQDLLDHLGVDSPESVDVTREGTAEAERALGVSRGLQASARRGSSELERESFSVRARPAHLMNLAIDGLRDRGEFIDFDASPDSGIVHRHAIEISGELTLEPASEVAQIFAAMLPLMASAPELFAPDSTREPTAEEIGGVMLQSNPGASRAIMTLRTHDGKQRVLLPLEPDHLLVDDYGDIEGDMTVFGVVERLIPAGGNRSLRDFLLPSNLSRVFRRSLPDEHLLGLMNSLSPQTGRSFGPEDLRFDGPGAVLGVGAIYP